MNGRTLKPIFLVALAFLLAVPAFSQRSKVKVYSTDGEGNCGPNISAYRTFTKLELYDDAKPTWIKVFNQCPDSSEIIYLDGVIMYRFFIKEAPEGPVKEGLIDTLMLIYDRRIENFGGEGNVLGRKGRDLLTFRGGDINEVEKAYDMLRRSIDLSGKETQDAVMLLCISAGINLAEKGRIDTNQVLADYISVNSILVQREKRGTRWERTRESIDDMMLKEEILTCEALNRYYEPQFELNKEDLTFLETVIFSYEASECDRSAYYAAASEELYKIDPSPESAHNVAIQFITMNDLHKAAYYLKMAVEGAYVDTETRALWYYELAVVSNANKDFCEAIDFAREAIRLKNEYGKAYFLLGDAYIAYRDSLGDDFQQRTAFWAAADKYRKAAIVDPSLAEDTSERLDEIAAQYPDKEDNFFLDLKEGDPYQVGGCINESTTVRSRK
jgi:gluconate kinase